MKTRKLQLLLFAGALLFSLANCSQPSDKKVSEGNDLKEISTRGDTSLDEAYVKLETERFILEERALAFSKLNEFLEDNPESYQMIAGQKFRIDFRMVVKQGHPAKVENETLEFSQDFAYKWYKDNELAERGKYYFDEPSSTLLFLSNNDQDFPSEWTIKSAGDVIVLVGTSTFKNNNTQMRMELVSN